MKEQWWDGGVMQTRTWTVDRMVVKWVGKGGCGDGMALAVMFTVPDR